MNLRALGIAAVDDEALRRVVQYSPAGRGEGLPVGAPQAFDARLEASAAGGMVGTTRASREAGRQSRWSRDRELGRVRKAGSIVATFSRRF